MPAKSLRTGSRPGRKPASTSAKPPKKAKKVKPRKKVNTDPFTSKQVSFFYFKCVLADDGEPTAVYVCRCGVERRMEPKTGYTNLLGQDTRWSSTFAMVKRYFELKEYLDDDDDDELTAVMPSRHEEKTLKEILANLKMFESTSKRLQSGESITLLDVRDLFDALIAQKPEVAHYLDAEAAIVKSIAFERACVNVLLGREGLLAADDVAMLEPLVAEAAPPPRSAPATSLEQSFAAHVLDRARRRRQTTPRFVDHVATIAPTSNVVERFFSQAKAVVGMHRQAMSPLHLESILFLKVNRTYWDAATVRKVVCGEQ